MAFPFVSARKPQPSSTVRTIGLGRLLMVFARRLSRGHLLQRREEAIHFLLGVVMDQAHAKEAAAGFDAEAFGQIQRVVVAVPRENAAFAEEPGDFRGMVISQPHRNRRTALLKSLWIADAEKAQAGNGEQPFGEMRKKRHLMLASCAIGCEK